MVVQNPSHHCAARAARDIFLRRARGARYILAPRARRKIYYYTGITTQA